MNEIFLKIDNVCKKFSHFFAVNNIGLEVLLEALFLELESKRDEDYDCDPAKEQSITIQVEQVS